MNFDDFESNAFIPEHSYPEVSGFDENSELSNNDVEALIHELLPASHVEHCPSILCSPENPVWDEYPDAFGLYNTQTCEIFLSGREGVMESGTTELEVLLHEIGHSAYDALLEENPLKAAEWAELYDNSEIMFAETGFGFVSIYSHTDMFEDFAESYAEYVANPELMQFLCPDKYHFMSENVFGGREYSTVLSPDGSYVLAFKDMADSMNEAVASLPDTGELDFADIHYWNESEPVSDTFRCFSLVASS